MVHLTSSVLGVNGSLIAKAQLKYNSSMKVVESFNKMAYKIGCQLEIDNEPHYTIEHKNVAFSVAQPMNGSVMYVLAGKRDGDNSYAVVSDYLDYNDVTLQSAMRISSSVIQRAEKNYITSINYQNNLFFLKDDELMKLAEQGVEEMTRQNISENGLVVQSNIFSVSVGNDSITGLSDPVSIMFRNNSIVSDEYTCRFWDFSLGMIFLCFIYL